MIVEEDRPYILEEQSPSNVVAGVLSELASHWEVAELESSGEGGSMMLRPLPLKNVGN